MSRPGHRRRRGITLVEVAVGLSLAATGALLLTGSLASTALQLEKLGGAGPVLHAACTTGVGSMVLVTEEEPGPGRGKVVEVTSLAVVQGASGRELALTVRVVVP